MPIEKIQIRGFQKHRDLIVELSPGITTILGATDAGKSAIVRAARWLAMNRPAGDAFRRSGSKTCQVELTIDGQKVTRRKGRDNVYKLDDSKFAAMGARVPEPVAELLNLSELNFARQFDPPFWLADSPGAVSRHLNAIVDLGVIDDTLGAVAAVQRRAAAAVDVSRERLAAARTERDSLAWVPGYLGKLRELEKLQDRIDRRRRDTAALASLIADVESAEQTAGDAVAGRSVAQAAVSAGERWAAAERRARELQELIRMLTDAETDYKTIRAAAAVERARFQTKTKGRRCPICQKPIQ